MLKLLPAYTGATSLEEALLNPRAVRILWLEILVNDQLDLSPFSDEPMSGTRIRRPVAGIPPTAR
jgi:hypothetical protein